MAAMNEGRTFQSYEEFAKELQEYCETTAQTFVVADSKKKFSQQTASYPWTSSNSPHS